MSAQNIRFGSALMTELSGPRELVRYEAAGPLLEKLRAAAP